MIRLRIASVVSSLALVAPAGLAEAHVLTVARARDKARSEAYVIAGSVSSGRVPRVSIRSCSRASHHIVDCVARFRYSPDGGVVCLERIRVRFASSSSRSLLVSFPDPPICTES